MKKLLSITAVLLALSSTSAYAGGLELLIGQRLDLRDYNTNFFAAGLAFGGKYLKLGINYSHASPAVGSYNGFRPYLMVDLPFGFSIGNNSELVIAPTIDFGPEIGFIAGEKVIDIMMLGFGLKTQFYFNDSIGVGLTPFHMSTSFGTYTTGGPGFTRQTRMTYDLFFSLLYRW